MIRSVPDLLPELSRQGALEGLRERRYDILGRCVAVHSNDARLLRLADSLLGAFGTCARGADAHLYALQAHDGTALRYRLVDPGFNSFECDDWSHAVSFWMAQLMVNHVYRGRHLLLHAAAIGDRGQALVFTGGARSGKSTLAVKLMQAGCRLYSDEFAALHIDTGRVHPFPRALLLREDAYRRLGGVCEADDSFDDSQEPGVDGRPARRWVIPAARLGAEPAAGPAPVGAVFCLDGFGAAAAEMLPMPAAEGLEALVRQCPNAPYMAQDLRAAAFAALTGVLVRAPAFRVRLGPVDEPGAAILARLRDAVASVPLGLDALDAVAARCRAALEGAT